MPETLVSMPHKRHWMVRIRYGILFFSFLLFLLPVVLTPQSATSDWVYFLGRFHPLIIHFPIVILSLLLLLEMLDRIRAISLSANIRWVFIGLAVFSSVAAVILGGLLFRTGDYSGQILQLHLWSGIIVAVGSCWLLFIQLERKASSSQLSHKFYWGTLIFTNAALVFASHQGGSLTHGTDYLTEYAPSLTHVPMKAKSEMLVYTDVIAPMLDAKCYSCHNEHKTKGDLLMTNLADLMKGGESGEPGLVAGYPEQSSIWTRATLPVTHDDHMPPEGKPSLTVTEVDLLNWWIETGANTDLAYTEALNDSVVARFLPDYVADLQIAHRRQWKTEQELNQLIEEVAHENAPFRIGRNPENSEQLALQMQFPPLTFLDKDLTDLRPVYNQLAIVSLVSSDITDDGLYYLGQMPLLQQLSLQKTGIDGSGLIYLTDLANLRTLDLSYTKVTDDNLLYVTRMNALRDLYLYETTISTSLLETLQSHLPELTIHRTRSPNY